MSEDGLIKVPYVQKVASGGKVHLYFRDRKRGHREGPLTSAFGTQDLKDEVEAIIRRLDRAAEAVARPKAGTVGGMLRAYVGSVVDGKRTAASADFLVLARSTQGSYQDLADEMIEDFGEVLLGEVTRSWIVDLKNAWAVRGHRAANNRMQVLKNALSPIIDDDADGRIEGDPFHKVKKVKRPHGRGEAHPIWDDEEVTVAISDALGRDLPGLARAIALARYGGFRRGTVCAIPRSARRRVTNQDGYPEKRLNWITEKKEVLCDKREDARLTDVLDRTPNRALTLAYNAHGHPWKERQLNQSVERHLDRLARAGKVRAETYEKDGKVIVYCPLTIHGLRHSRGVEIALSGGSDAEIMAQLEHATDRQAKEYRRQAERRQLADAAQDRMDNVIRLKAARKAGQ